MTTYALQDPNKGSLCWPLLEAGKVGMSMTVAQADADNIKVVSLDEARALGVIPKPAISATPAPSATVTKARRLAEAVQANDKTRAELADKQAQRERAAYLDSPAGRAELAGKKAEAERVAYAEAILSLPEAQERPRTAAKIALAHNAQSLPIGKAQIFLAGLPVETSEPSISTFNSRTDPMADKTLKRKIELRASALSLRADQGDAAARKESNSLTYALKLHNAGTDLARALQMAGANVAAIR